jgi:hypothetical protein
MPEPSLLISAAVFGGLVPAGVAAVVLLLAFRLTPRDKPEAAWAGGPALACGFLAAYALLGAAPWQPTASWHWLVWLAVVGGAAGGLEGSGRLSKAALWVVRLVIAAAAAWLLTPALPELQTARPAWVAGLAAAVVLLWSVLAELGRRQSGPWLPFLLVLVHGAAALVLEGAGFGTLAQLAGVLAAVLAACAVICWFVPGRSAVVGTAPGVAVVLTGTLANGWFYNSGDVPWISFILVLAAPLSLLVRHVRPVRDASPRRQALVQLIAALLFLVPAVILARPW